MYSLFAHLRRHPADWAPILTPSNWTLDADRQEKTSFLTSLKFFAIIIRLYIWPFAWKAAFFSHPLLSPRAAIKTQDEMGMTSRAWLYFWHQVQERPNLFCVLRAIHFKSRTLFSQIAWRGKFAPRLCNNSASKVIPEVGRKIRIYIFIAFSPWCRLPMMFYNSSPFLRCELRNFYNFSHT